MKEEEKIMKEEAQEAQEIQEVQEVQDKKEVREVQDKVKSLRDKVRPLQEATLQIIAKRLEKAKKGEVSATTSSDKAYAEGTLAYVEALKKLSELEAPKKQDKAHAAHGDDNGSDFKKPYKKPYTKDRKYPPSTGHSGFPGKSYGPSKYKSQRHDSSDRSDRSDRFDRSDRRNRF